MGRYWNVVFCCIYFWVCLDCAEESVLNSGRLVWKIRNSSFFCWKRIPRRAGKSPGTLENWIFSCSVQKILIHNLGVMKRGWRYDKKFLVTRLKLIHKIQCKTYLHTGKIYFKHLSTSLLRRFVTTSTFYGRYLINSLLNGATWYGEYV